MSEKRVESGVEALRRCMLHKNALIGWEAYTCIATDDAFVFEAIDETSTQSRIVMEAADLSCDDKLGCLRYKSHTIYPYELVPLSRLLATKSIHVTLRIRSEHRIVFPIAVEASLRDRVVRKLKGRRGITSEYEKDGTYLIRLTRPTTRYAVDCLDYIRLHLATQCSAETIQIGIALREAIQIVKGGKKGDYTLKCETPFTITVW